MSSKIPPEIQERVRLRANYLCEYCHTSEQWQYVLFQMEHVFPQVAGGDDKLENLALACFPCNRRKSDKRFAPDPQTGEDAALFNPREDRWSEHFIWSADSLCIIPMTPVGRATECLLRLNRERVKEIRAEDIKVRRHPPEGDPIRP